MTDFDFFYELFKNIPGFICGTCEDGGGPGTVMAIPINGDSRNEFALYFDFYGRLHRGEETDSSGSRRKKRPFKETGSSE